MSKLFRSGPIINVGLASFAESIRSAGATAVQVEWSPPAHGDRTVGWSLATLVNHPEVEAANRVITVLLAPPPR